MSEIDLLNIKYHVKIVTRNTRNPWKGTLEHTLPKNLKFLLKVRHLVLQVDKLVNLYENENLNENLNASSTISLNVKGLSDITSKKKSHS